MKAEPLLAPERRRQHHQQREQFQSAEQHGKGADPGLEIGQYGIGGGRADLAQAGAGVVDAGDDGGKRR
jgi:hypothetical protein